MTRRESFTIRENGLGRYSLNTIYAGKHWRKRKDEATYWHALVQAELRRQNIPQKKFAGSVVVEMLFNSRMDIDNHGYLAKLIIDGLKGYLLVDDTQRWVRRLEIGCHAGEGVVVTLTEMKGEHHEQV